MAINMAAAMTPVMMRLFILPPGVVRVKSRKMVFGDVGMTVVSPSVARSPD
jgi:hypothetical protein